MGAPPTPNVEGRGRGQRHSLAQLRPLKLSRNRTGEGQRQHRDFEGERKGFEGWLARNRRAPAKLHRGSKGTGLEGIKKSEPAVRARWGNLGKFSTEPFQNAAKCSSPSALFKRVISISSLNGLARKPIAPDASACARAFISGKAVTKMIGK
jgi:hypothetical protein